MDNNNSKDIKINSYEDFLEYLVLILAELGAKLEELNVVYESGD